MDVRQKDRAGRPAQTTHETLDWREGRGATKLKCSQVIVNELFIYTLIGYCYFTAPMIKVNKIH